MKVYKNKQITRKIGVNRGKNRIWIEGNSLTDFDWLKGVTYKKEVSTGLMVLEKTPKGQLKVAGGEGRPVLDLCGLYVNANFEGFESVTIEISKAAIVIEGAE